MFCGCGCAILGKIKFLSARQKIMEYIEVMCFLSAKATLTYLKNISKALDEKARRDLAPLSAEVSSVKYRSANVGRIYFMFGIVPCLFLSIFKNGFPKILKC